MIRGWAFTISVFVLLFGPSGGNLTLFSVLDLVGSRMSKPVTDQERVELDFFRCLEVTAGAIPDMAKVEKVLPAGDQYLEQRVGDVMYPRVRFATFSADYRLYVSVDPGEAELIAAQNCGPYFVGVEKID